MKVILVGILGLLKGEVGCPWDYHRTIEGNHCCINVLGCWVSQTGKLHEVFFTPLFRQILDEKTCEKLLRVKNALKYRENIRFKMLRL